MLIKKFVLEFKSVIFLDDPYFTYFKDTLIYIWIQMPCIIFLKQNFNI